MGSHTGSPTIRPEGGDIVLTVTHEASQAIRDLTDAAPEPDSAGLRISVEAGDGGAPQLALSLAEGPFPDDQVVDAEGAHVFLAESVSDFMDDKTLDATVQDEGVAFSIQANGAPPPA
jgi:Fe-S cluster assembly iron-binding protein IscA